MQDYKLNITAFILEPLRSVHVGLEVGKLALGNISL